jgi:hypothetical protein
MQNKSQFGEHTTTKEKMNENISNTGPTDGWIYPIKGKNCWQYFAAYHSF